MRKKHSIKLSFAHGYADNISFGLSLPSTVFDRSFIFDKMQMTYVHKDRKIDYIKNVGIFILLEQRYYDLESEKFLFDNWKYYLDGRTKVWIGWDILDNIGIKTWYQYRWRDAETQLYGDFEWVEEFKSFSKHEIWVEFSHEFISNILY
ncbi:uncharacterized protein METZ01_LOCUS416689 [marine metagenome]|uniref:Uncharacterized protein n=1 Tax=marine metagenome TaxID=408172 RepID=A0A382WZQ5_9ZZZZ